VIAGKGPGLAKDILYGEGPRLVWLGGRGELISTRRAKVPLGRLCQGGDIGLQPENQGGGGGEPEGGNSPGIRNVQRTILTIKKVNYVSADNNMAREG